MIFTLRDVTAQVELEEQLAAKSVRDPLTGLPNRVLFADRVEQALARCSDTDHQVAILIADLDRFKAVNDTRGHAIGDQVLIEAGRRLRRLPDSQTATVARMADDEFALLLEGSLDRSDVVETAEAVRAALAEPFTLAAGQVVVTVSIGLAGPTDADGADELLRRADVAMNQAKVSGRNRVEVFDPEVDQVLGSQAILLSALREAVQGDRISVAYQPIYSVDRRLFGYETLARWDGSDGSPVPPDAFIPLAEGAGLMPALGARLLELAFDRAADVGVVGVMSVNISGLQLADSGFSRLVLETLAARTWPPSRLMLEITETVITENRPVVRTNLEDLREAGVRIAIDDFGTGYSSLGALKHLPIDTLKIDRIFIQDMLDRNEDAVMLGTIIGLAHALGYAVVAEGVEESDQITVLAGLHCDLAQGFLFSPAVPAEEIASLLNTGTYYPIARSRQSVQALPQRTADSHDR